MPRRVSMPTADDLFRPTAVHAVPDAPEVTEDAREAPEPAVPKPSGRIRHDEKMTVYVTSDELLHIEQARLTLRSAHGLAVDRGRLVREAVALVLADFDAQGDDSGLVRRLTEV
ncbi:hypothetical protein [Nocardioides sp. cx-173]|uniref:hypothetical protein n=1 Tax=Nocardioides sp. cx-173 TaxID=2898796 RepID=UPI001E4EABFE|nr:hypothetical protein [Nocardioides sp. cx-173]MCD4527397.1 hypothetical protein [Nocardioides sp. cx-173]UGB43847.1 hypothetical protein LQ940_10095 [Nocardioides sp. cx-173]